MSKIIRLDPESDVSTWDVPQIDSGQPMLSRSSINQQKLKDEAQQLKNSATSQGYQEGLKKAEVEYQAKMAQLVELIDLMINPVNFLSQEVNRNIEALTGKLAQHCINKELEQDPEILRTIIDTALASMTEFVGPKKLYLCQEDVNFLNESGLLASQESGQLTVAASSKLNRGEYIIETESEKIDARISSRLNAILNESQLDE